MAENRPILLDAQSLSRQMSASARVADINLTLRRGDVLGLLGLNGAGKSTTLNMMAGVTVPDAGSVTVAGYSLAEQPLQARAALGYLPDTPPLYPDMRVAAYLKLAAQLRRVPKREVKSAVDYASELCDLGAVQKHRIAALSKGFRQRVGLAQAIIHKPQLILLDEPSNGLDPHQMQGMRKLIQRLGEESAVVFSTHLLPEAVATCNRIAVMHHGRIVASELDNELANGSADTPANLTNDNDQTATPHTVQPLQRDELETLFSNLVQFGTPKAPITTLSTKAPQPAETSHEMDA